MLTITSDCRCQILKVEVFDEDLHPGTTSDDDDLLGRVDVELEGSLTINTPIRKWFTLGDLGMIICRHNHLRSGHV